LAIVVPRRSCSKFLCGILGKAARKKEVAKKEVAKKEAAMESKQPSTTAEFR
jgi:hypothetical protein